jgi:molecular chaperone DnaK (HSP70)
MKITTAQLRQIIKEELEKEMGLVDEGLDRKTLIGILASIAMGGAIGTGFKSLPQDKQQAIVTQLKATEFPEQIRSEITDKMLKLDDDKLSDEEKEKLKKEIKELQSALKTAEFIRGRKR